MDEAPYDVVVLGAGAAGLLAAARAAARGRRTLLLEKNRRPGVKILMSGGTRCNLTQATDARGIVEAFGKPGRFLRPAVGAFPPGAVIRLVESEGVPTKVEPQGGAGGDKVFPASDSAGDVLAALLRHLARSGATVATGEPALALRPRGEQIEVVTSRRTLAAPRVIVTVGGRSYPRSGTSGDAYAWAAALGHAVVPPRPALVPLATDEGWVRTLRGLAVPDVEVAVEQLRGERLASRRGAMLFTHFGLSGPAVLDVSREVSASFTPATRVLACDFLPDLPAERLLATIRAPPGRRPVGRAVPRLPQRLVDALLALAGIPADRIVARLEAAEGARLVEALKRTRIPLTGTLGFGKAEVTAGGVALAEVDPRTLRSRIVPGLSWAGEVLDIDGPIGGYNFQAAFSTGYLAGEHA